MSWGKRDFRNFHEKSSEFTSGLDKPLLVVKDWESHIRGYNSWYAMVILKKVSCFLLLPWWKTRKKNMGTATPRSPVIPFESQTVDGSGSWVWINFLLKEPSVLQRGKKDRVRLLGQRSCSTVKSCCWYWVLYRITADKAGPPPP